MTEYILYWLIAANGIAFVLMVIDKRRAETGDQRISENALLGWAFFGGAAGTVLASRLVRHKTRKQPFATTMFVYLGLQLLLLGLWLFGVLDPLAATALAYWRAAS